MRQAPKLLDPWKLVWGQPFIDSQTLALAIEQDLEREQQPDFRSRLLVRDSALALRAFWGVRRFSKWLNASPLGSRIREILNEDLGQSGFSTIRSRLVDSVNATQLKQILIDVSKLSSRQEKPQHDLRVLAYKLDKEKARLRLLINGRAFLDDPKLKPQIEENWRFIFQEPLFGEEAAKSERKPRRGRKEGPQSSPGKPLPKRSRRTKRDDET